LKPGPIQFRYKPALTGLVVAVVCMCGLSASADAQFDKAVKAYNAKDYRGAYSTLQLVLKKTPNDVNALYYAALCCSQFRNFAGATAIYNRIVQTDPNSAAAGFARTALSSMAPAAVAPAQSARPVASQNAVTAPIQSIFAAAPGADMSALPDHASFYFTKESGGHMGVTIMVNGHQVPAYFDTGASAYFYKDQLLAAGIDCNRAQKAGFGQGWAGTPVPVYAMEAEVKLGTLTRKIPIVFEEGNTGLQKNLIGQSMIQGYQYEIDDKGGRVDLKKTIEKTEQKFNSMYDIPLKVVGSQDIIEIEVNGQRVQTFIDTGAVSTVIDNPTAQRCGIDSTGSQSMTGVGGAFTVGLGTARIRLGPISKECGIHIGGSGGNCIGQDIMEGWRFKIDREHGLLRFFH